MCAETYVDVRYKTLGVCEAVPYANLPTAAVKNSAIHNKRATVRLQPHITKRLAHSTRRYGDQQTIPPLTQTASRPS